MSLNTRPPQQLVTRIPPYRPGEWVKIHTEPPRLHRQAQIPPHLSGRVLQVKSLTCAIVSAELPAVWRVHFTNGTSIEWHLIDRPATAREIEHYARRVA